MHASLGRSAALVGIIAVLFLGLLAPATLAAGPGAAVSASPTVVRQKPCPDSIFTCVTIRVPRDHFAAAGGPTFDVTFALHKAKAKTRKGVFVTVTGGPGTSGIAAADSYTEAFDPAIVKDYDIVFFDQRGIGQSQPMYCLQSALTWYTSDHLPTISAAQALAFAQDSKKFTADCIAETGVATSNMGYFGTRQAVEDLDAFRVYLKADKLDLYGESYGTQYAQTYAAVHPDHLHSLMIDGSVDLSLTAYQFLAEQTHAFADVLGLTLDACTGDPSCRKDVAGHDGLAAYDSLAAKLRSGPLPYTFVGADGSTETRSFSLGDLETAASGYIYSNTDRMELQRAIAQASRGQLLPLARLAYISLEQDPDTLEAIPDESWSDALYYGVECNDYWYGNGSAAQQEQAYLAAGAAAHLSNVRLGSIFYGDLPCPYWPTHPATSARPANLTTTPFPVFVLTATWDPATPHQDSLRIMSHLSDGYLVVEPGGPHVLFGRGNACVDDPITAFLLDGTRPASRTTTCDFTGPDPYVPIPAAKVADYKNALAAMTAMDDEINYSADYWNWGGVDPLAYGCLFGGTIEYTAYKDGYKAALDGCAFTAGLPLTGTATIDTTHETFRLKASSSGQTSLDYKRDADGKRSVTGTYFGKTVSLKG